MAPLERRELDFPTDLSKPGTHHFLLTDPAHGTPLRSAFELSACPGDTWNLEGRVNIFVFSENKEQ